LFQPKTKRQNSRQTF